MACEGILKSVVGGSIGIVDIVGIVGITEGNND